jgi:hypothetical protein
MWGEAYVFGVHGGGLGGDGYGRTGRAITRNSISDDRRNKQSRGIEDNSREASEHYELSDTEQCC